MVNLLLRLEQFTSGFQTLEICTSLLLRSFYKTAHKLPLAPPTSLSYRALTILHQLKIVRLSCGFHVSLELLYLLKKQHTILREMLRLLIFSPYDTVPIL